MSAWDIYWVMQADRLVMLFEVFAWISLLPVLFGAIGLVITRGIAIADEDEKAARASRALLKPWLVCLAVMLTATIARNVFPSTKTLAAMWTIPAVVNNETLQTDAAEIYELGMERLKEVLGPQHTEQGKDEG